MKPVWTDAEEERARILFDAGNGDAEIATALGRSQRAVKEWRRRAGLTNHPAAPAPIPDDFGTYYPAHTMEDCAEHWGMSSWTIQRWAKEARIVRVPIKKSAEAAPPHFAKVAPTLTIKEAMAHFNRGDFVIRAWYKAEGISPNKRTSLKVSKSNWGAPTVNIRSDGDASLPGRAAHYLRHIHANVYSARILEPARIQQEAISPDHYFVSGKGFMPSAAMIDLARAKGFEVRV